MKKTTSMISIISILAVVMVSGLAMAGTSGPSPIPNPPTFSVTSNLTTLCKGQTNYVPIMVSNLGNTNPSLGISNLSGTIMQYTSLSLLSTKSLTVAGNGTNYIGRILPYNSVTLDMPIFVASNASLITTAGISINYYYLTYYEDSEVRNMTFEVQTCPSQLQVSINPKTIESGTIQNLSINLTNTGNSTIKSLYVHFSVPSIDGAIVGSQQAEVGSLTPGSEYYINAQLFVSRNASIESFPMNLTATFYTGNNLEQLSNSTSLIPIGGINLLSSGLTLSPTSTTPGGIFSISFVLTDVGTSGASAVTAMAELPKGFASFGSNPVYVGDISSDSQAPVTLTLVVGNSTASGTYKIPILINYLNSLRQNETTMIYVNATVVGSNFTSRYSGTTGPAGARVVMGGGNGLLLGWSIISVIIIIALSYAFVKEKKKHDAHFSVRKSIASIPHWVRQRWKQKT